MSTLGSTAASASNSGGQLDAQTPPILRKRGWKKQGVILIQFLVIFIFVGVEIFIRDKVGIVSGIGILLAFLSGAIKGRSGTSFTAAVNPPISLLVASLLILPTIGSSKLSISRLGVDTVNLLASLAPYLIVGAIIGWAYHFKENRNSRA